MTAGMDYIDERMTCACDMHERLTSELREDRKRMAVVWQENTKRFEVLIEMFKREELRCTRALMANLDIDANKAVELLDFDDEARHTVLEELRRDARQHRQ